MAHKLGTGRRKWGEREVEIEVAYTHVDVISCHGKLRRVREDESDQSSCQPKLKVRRTGETSNKPLML